LLPDTLAHVFTVFVQRDEHVPSLQLLYHGPYAVLRRSLHHFTQQISDKVDKVLTLWLKPCNDPTEPPAKPQAKGHPPVVSLGDFPPQGVTTALWVHFAPPRAPEPHRNRFLLASRQGVFTPRRLSRPSSCPANTRPPGTGQTRPLALGPPASRSGRSPVEAITASSQTTTFLLIYVRHPLHMRGFRPCDTHCP